MVNIVYWRKDFILGTYVPKPRYRYEARRSEGLWVHVKKPQVDKINLMSGTRVFLHLAQSKCRRRGRDLSSRPRA